MTKKIIVKTCEKCPYFYIEEDKFGYLFHCRDLEFAVAIDIIGLDNSNEFDYKNKIYPDCKLSSIQE